MLSAVTESGLPACFTFYAAHSRIKSPQLNALKHFYANFSYLDGIILFLLAKFCFLQCYTESHFLLLGLIILKHVY
jgi:hypothetical protein